ncbi:shikimate kinase [Salsuginibacillus halophilus]|nr:shikimate kinase [Salsuginibacillus halophilus]
MEEAKKSVILVGFMGVGKTTAGALAAQQLDRTFVDIDDEIVKAFDMTIPDIFSAYGEDVFREKERELVEAYCTASNQVISLGGGVFMNDALRRLCLEHGLVVHLDMSWEAWTERLDDIIDTRPVLQKKNVDEIESLFYERKDLYKDHHMKVMTDGLSEEAVAEAIVSAVRTN